MEPLKFKEIQEGMEDPRDFSAQLAAFGDGLIKNGMRRRKKEKAKSPVIPQETTESQTSNDANAAGTENVAPNESPIAQEQQGEGASPTGDNLPNESPIPQEQQTENAAPNDMTIPQEQQEVGGNAPTENRSAPRLIPLNREGMERFGERLAEDIKRTRTSLSKIRGRNAQPPFYEQWKAGKARLYGRNPEDEETKKAFRDFEDLSDTLPGRLERQEKKDLLRAMNPEERYNAYKDMIEKTIAKTRELGEGDGDFIPVKAMDLYRQGVPFKVVDQEFRKAGLLNSENEKEFYKYIDELAPLEFPDRKNNERFLKEIIRNPFKKISGGDYRNTPLGKRFKRFITGQSSDFLTRKLQEAQDYRDRLRSNNGSVRNLETIEELPPSNDIIPEEIRPIPRAIRPTRAERRRRRALEAEDQIVPVLNANAREYFDEDQF
jgi:hypothetical protein